MRLHLAQDPALVHVVLALEFCAEAHRLAVEAAFDDFLNALKRTAADEENIVRVDLDKFLVRVLAPALRRDVGDRTLDNLQQRLLHTLAGNVARDGGILALAGDLVDLVDIDDATLGKLHIVIRRLQEAKQNVLHIVADIARFGERRRVCDRKRHLQDTGKRREEGLAAAGGAKKQDIALLQLNFVAATEENALIVVVNGHGQRNFRRLLPDDILVEHLVDLARRGNGIRCLQLVMRLVAVFQHVHAQLHALIANAHAGALDHAMHFTLALTAERAAKFLLLIFTHHAKILISCK